MSNDCPDPNILAAFTEGNLRPWEQEMVEAHLVRCAVCLDVVAFVIKSKSLVPFPYEPPES